MYLQELNTIRKDQFDLEILLQQRSRSTHSLLFQIETLSERITHEVLRVQTSMFRHFRDLELQVATLGIFLSQKLDIPHQLSDLSAFQAQFNIILEIQSDLELVLRKKKWYSNTIELKIDINISVPTQSVQIPVLKTQKSIVRKPKRKKEPKIKPAMVIDSKVSPKLFGGLTSLPIGNELSISNALNEDIFDKETVMQTSSECEGFDVLIPSSHSHTDSPHSNCSMDISPDIMAKHLDSNANQQLENPDYTQALNSNEFGINNSVMSQPCNSYSIAQAQSQELDFTSMLFDSTTDLSRIENSDVVLEESQVTDIIDNNSPLLNLINTGDTQNTTTTISTTQQYSLHSSQIMNASTQNSFEVVRENTQKTKKFPSDNILSKASTPGKNKFKNITSVMKPCDTSAAVATDHHRMLNHSRNEEAFTKNTTHGDANNFPILDDTFYSDILKMDNTISLNELPLSSQHLLQSQIEEIDTLTSTQDSVLMETSRKVAKFSNKQAFPKKRQISTSGKIPVVSSQSKFDGECDLTSSMEVMDMTDARKDVTDSTILTEIIFEDSQQNFDSLSLSQFPFASQQNSQSSHLLEQNVSGENRNEIANKSSKFTAYYDLSNHSQHINKGRNYLPSRNNIKSAQHDKKCEPLQHVPRVTCLNHNRPPEVEPRLHNQFSSTQPCSSKPLSNHNSNPSKLPNTTSSTQQSILNYVSSPPHIDKYIPKFQFLIDQKWGNSLSAGSRNNSQKNTKIPSRKVNTRPFYSMNVLMIQKQEVTNDLDPEMWLAADFPQAVLTRLIDDITFW